MVSLSWQCEYCLDYHISCEYFSSISYELDDTWSQGLKSSFCCVSNNTNLNPKIIVRPIFSGWLCPYCRPAERPPRVALALAGGGRQDGELGLLLGPGPRLALRPRGPGPPTPRHAPGLQRGFPKVRDTVATKSIIDFPPKVNIHDTRAPGRRSWAWGAHLKPGVRAGGPGCPGAESRVS